MLVPNNSGLLQTWTTMSSALEYYSRQGQSLKMTTGSGELDSLIDGIEQGLLYFFYGDNIPLITLTNRLLVNCIMPVKLKHGFESIALCLNNTDYYGSRKLILNPERIANCAKAAGIDPKIVSKNLLIQTAYTFQHQLQVANEIADLIARNQDIKLVVINNLTKFFRDSREERKLETANQLKQVVAIISKPSAKNKVAVVVTGDANVSGKGVIPRPIGGTFLKHMANVIVYFRDISTTLFTPRFKATLVKHSYTKTPSSTIIHGRKCGRNLVLLN